MVAMAHSVIYHLCLHIPDWTVGGVVRDVEGD